jgi:hypothetical protein
MGNQCAGCGGDKEEGELNMRVEVQNRKAHAGQKTKARQEFKAEDEEYYAQKEKQIVKIQSQIRGR